MAIRYFNTDFKYKRRATIKHFACEGHGRKMNFFQNAGPSSSAVSEKKNAERGIASIFLFFCALDVALKQCSVTVQKMACLPFIGICHFKLAL